jgi:hypothetical protein
MGFLDRFKPQPRWKHADAAVRAAAVEALSDHEQDVLRSIAAEDPDPAVRRTALARVTDVATLARIAREDADEGVRAEARELVAEIARDSTEETEAFAALEGLDDSRELAVVARAAETEAVALAALARLKEERVVSVVARQANHAGVRQAALARLSSPEELLAVAIKSDHKDAGVTALDRLTTREQLELVATRARNKAVSRRAKAQLRALEEAERIPLQQAARRQQLCEAVESLLRSTNLSKAEEQLVAAVTEWEPLAADAAPALVARFEQAASSVRELLARSEAERAEHERQAQVLADEMAQATASRLAVIERLEALETDEAGQAVDEARTVWVALVPWPEAVRESPQARALDERFARACATIEKRVARRAELAARRGEFEEGLRQAEAAAALPDVVAARAAFGPIRHAWQQATMDGVADPELLERFHAIEAGLARREAEQREQRARQAADTLVRLERLCQQVEALVATPELTLKDAERGLRDARAAIDHPGHLPTKQDRDRLVHRLKEAHTALFPRVQELRDAEDWRRWANASVQEELCKKAEALKEIQDTAEAAKALRDLQAEWKKVGAAPRENAEVLWQRFKAACDAERPRLDAYFGAQREQEADNLRAKEALCARAEALADSTDWIRTAEELKRLQAEWQNVGPVPHEQAKVAWQRFRTACDRFFTRRKDDLSQRKRMWAENLTRKEAICARAEELASSTEWDSAASEIKRLQVEWKAIGPVKPSRSEAIWQRFRSACDAFFERYKHRDQLAFSDALATREAICLELEAVATALAPAPPSAPVEDGTAGDAPAAAGESAAPVPPADLQRAVLDHWQRWHQSPRMPWSLAEPLERRFDVALSRILGAAPEAFRGTRLDVDANLRRMEELCVQVEGLAGSRPTASDLATAPPQALATLLKDALAANTIGGRVDEEAKRRASATIVKDAQNAWRRLGPVPGERGRQLNARFGRACKRFFDQARPSAPAPPRPTPA